MEKSFRSPAEIIRELTDKQRREALRLLKAPESEQIAIAKEMPPELLSLVFELIAATGGE